MLTLSIQLNVTDTQKLLDRILSRLDEAAIANLLTRWQLSFDDIINDLAREVSLHGIGDLEGYEKALASGSRESDCLIRLSMALVKVQQHPDAFYG